MSTIDAEQELARVARAMGDPARATMLGALLGGRALAAGELARRARISASTASQHLHLLVETRLVVRRIAGRHRYYALAGVEVAEALEGLARLAPPPQGKRLARPPAERALRFARTCYDHLAGTLGVQLAHALRSRGLITGTDAYDVTPAGESWLAALGIDSAQLRRGRRPLARPCLDWTERRDHVAGAVGAAIAASLLERGWLARIEGTRAVRLTLRGRDGLSRTLGLELAPEEGAGTPPGRWPDEQIAEAGSAVPPPSPDPRLPPHARPPNIE